MSPYQAKTPVQDTDQDLERGAGYREDILDQKQSAGQSNIRQ